MQIDGFVAATKQMLGKEVREKPHWNTHASGDAIYHFARGIGDDNPLYLDPDYGPNSPIGGSSRLRHSLPRYSIQSSTAHPYPYRSGFWWGR